MFLVELPKWPMLIGSKDIWSYSSIQLPVPEGSCLVARRKWQIEKEEPHFTLAAASGRNKLQQLRWIKEVDPLDFCNLTWLPIMCLHPVYINILQVTLQINILWNLAFGCIWGNSLREALGKNKLNITIRNQDMQDTDHWDGLHS